MIPFHPNPCYKNEGPLLMEKFGDFLFVEALQKSPIYFTCWQHDWRLLWVRPRVKDSLSWINLEKEKVHLDGFKMYQYRCSYDIKEKKSCILNLIQLPEYQTKKLACTFNRVGEVIRYAQTGSDLNLPEDHQDVLNSCMLQVLKDDLHPPLTLYSHESTPDILNPLANFDNPLWLLTRESKSSMKTPTIEIGPKCLIRPLKENEHNLPSISMSHVGCTAWIIIHPSSNELLRRKVAEEVNKANVVCHCILRDNRYCVTLQQLDLWGVLHTVIYQEEGDILLLLPGVIYFTVNLTFTVNSFVYFLPLGKLEIEILQNFKKCECFRSKSEKLHDFRHGEWIPELYLNINKFVSEWMHSSLLAMVKTKFLPLSGKGDTEEEEARESAYPLPPQHSLSSPLLVQSSTPHSNNDTEFSLSPPMDSESDSGLELGTESPWDNSLPSISSFISSFEDLEPRDTEPVQLQDIIISNSDKEEFDKIFQQIQDSCFENINDCVDTEPGVQLLSYSTTPPSIANDSENSIEMSLSRPILVLDTETLSMEKTPNERNADTDLTTIDKEDVARFMSSSEFCNSYNFANLSPEVTAGEAAAEGFAVIEDQPQQVAKRRRCPQCSQTLSNGAHLKRHMYLKHSLNNITVKCPICFKIFANSLNLERHRRPLGRTNGNNKGKKNLCRGVALGERFVDNRLRCEICGQRFTLKSGYRRHLRRKHQ